MYGLRLTLRSSAALTLRVLPSGLLDIITYPFVPPTTFSGWLRRIWMLAEGLELPGTTVKNAPFFVLPRALLSLGAYPVQRSHVHKTKRKGVKGFSDTSFSRLAFDRTNGPTFQLHSWEYLTTDLLHGYVLCAEPEPLKHLRAVLEEGGEALPYGCKLGKEGFAYLEVVGEVEALRLEEGEGVAQTLLPLEVLLEQTEPPDFAVHNVYRFVWGDGVEGTLEDPSPVRGYDLAPLGLLPTPQGRRASPTLHTRWWRGADWCVPERLLDALEGRP